jgi:hypothetical protein
VRGIARYSAGKQLLLLSFFERLCWPRAIAPGRLPAPGSARVRGAFAVFCQPGKGVVWGSEVQDHHVEGEAEAPEEEL